MSLVDILDLTSISHLINNLELWCFNGPNWKTIKTMALKCSLKSMGGGGRVSSKPVYANLCLILDATMGSSMFKIKI